MLMLILLLVAASPEEQGRTRGPFIPPVSPFEPSMVGLPQALHDPNFWEVPLEVCAHVVQEKAAPGEFVLRGGQWYLVVQPVAGAPSGKVACVKGVVARSDNLTSAEAERRGLRESATLHTIDRLRVLRECNSLPDCRRIIHGLEGARAPAKAPAG